MHSMGRRHRTVQHYRAIPNPMRRVSLQALDILDLVVYIIVGIAFVAAAIMALYFSLVNLGSHFGFPAISKNFGSDVLDFVSDLLLVLIIMEVLATIRSYLEQGDTTVKPFIFIGIISATRGILSIGARLVIGESSLGPDEFRNAMIELGVNALIIIILGATLRIMGNVADEPEAISDMESSDDDFAPATAATTTQKQNRSDAASGN